MQKILLALIGAGAVAGCATSQPQWKVRDRYGWPVQTWDGGGRTYAVARSRPCAHPQPAPTPTRSQNFVCCDEPVSLDSWGEYARACGGRHDHEPDYVTTTPTQRPVVAPPSTPAVYTPATRAVLTTRR